MPKAAMRPTIEHVRPLRTEAEYDTAVAEIDRLLDIDPAPGSDEADRLELLSLLVEAYDDKHYPISGDSTPQSVVLFLLEQQSKTRADLIPILGSKGRVSEFLNGKRRLSVAQIAALRAELGVSADLLLESGDNATYDAARPPVRRVRESRAGYAGDASAAAPGLTDAIAELTSNIKGLSARLDALAETQATMVEAWKVAGRQMLVLQQLVDAGAVTSLTRTNDEPAPLLSAGNNSTMVSPILGTFSQGLPS